MFYLKLNEYFDYLLSSGTRSKAQYFSIIIQKDVEPPHYSTEVRGSLNKTMERKIIFG